MYRALIKIFVALALATGLTYATGSASQAAPAERIAARAADCTAQENAVASANSTLAQDNAKVAKAKKAVTKAKKAVKKAKSTAAKKKAKKKLKKARAKYSAAKSRRDASASAASARQSELASCRANSGGGTTPQNGPTASPIQALCDNGLPQAVCDGLGGLIPGGTSLSTLATLCNQVPDAAPLCALLTSGPAIDSATLIDVLDQLLTTLGLNSLLGSVGELLGVGSVFSPTQLTDLLTQLGLTELVP